jgi:methionyl-tRNA formyltransferase
MSMKIIYMGSSQFGEPALRRLVASGHTVACVVTQPDKKQNRGMHVEATAIKKLAIELGLAVYQPVDVNAQESVQHLKAAGADVFVVIAYGQKLSQEVLDIPAIMPLNIHASLLPAYRGAAPINWAVINGDKVSGVTLMKVSYRMDTGPMLLQKPCEILEKDTAEALADKLSVDAAEILIEGLSRIALKDYKLVEQDGSKATFAPKLKRSDGLIDWNKPACSIVNQVRGCSPWPGAFTYYKGKGLKIHKASNVSYTGSDTVSAGQIVLISKDGIVVTAGQGSVLIESVQMEGKRIISAAEFIAGYKVCAADIFG